MIGLVEIKPIDSFVKGATVVVDGNAIHCCKGYTIIHDAGGIPTCKLDLGVNIDYTHVCDVKVSNIDEIASLLDDKSFQELCKLYKAKKGGVNEDNSKNDDI